MRNEFILKSVCGLVAALVLYRLILAIVHINPLYHVSIPNLPILVSATNSSQPNAAATNTFAKANRSSTNSPTQVVAEKGTNASVHSTNSVVSSTNTAAGGGSKLAEATNNAMLVTNELVLQTNITVSKTNSVAQNSNSPPVLAKTDIAAPPQLPGRRMPGGMQPGGFPGMPPGGMPGMGMPGMGVPGMGLPGMGVPGPPLKPEIQARIDKVIDSEILAQVMRPMPMALLGIAGKDAFLRAPNGQTGLVKEGDELGGVKLVRIGVNRVLVEEQGQRKELTIFAGLGSDSLLSTQKDSAK